MTSSVIKISKNGDIAQSKLKPGERETYKISMRKANKGKGVKFCLYTEDEETLLMAAKSVNNGREFWISDSALEIEDDSDHFIGKVFQVDITTQWLAACDISENECLSFVGNFVADRIYKRMSFKIPSDITHPLDELGDKADPKDIRYELREVTFSLDEFKMRAILSFNENLAFDLEQTFKEEFSLTIGYPTPLFQAFAFALVLIRFAHS